MKLNLGCGPRAIDGWLNVDYSIGARFMKVPFFHFVNSRLNFFHFSWGKDIFIHDLSKTFPWADGSADTIYCSHLLEHFSKEDGHYFLTECHRVLRVNGIFRIVVPDLKYFAGEYMKGKILSDDFVSMIGVLYGSEYKRNSLKKRLAKWVQFPHQCMYDETRLMEILKELGFSTRPRDPFDSEIPDIQNIEIKINTENAVIMEGIKMGKPILESGATLGRHPPGWFSSGSRTGIGRK
jgi:predicted SAM-dependent methyltransferase